MKKRMEALFLRVLFLNRTHTFCVQSLSKWRGVDGKDGLS